MRRNLTQLISGAIVVVVIFFVAQILAGVLSREGGDLIAVEMGRFDAPTAMVARPSTEDLFLTERKGRVHRIEVAANGSFSSSELVLDISDRVTTKIEGGLLSLAFSPNGNYLYLSYTNKNWQSQIVAYEMDANGPVGDTQRLILTVDQPQGDHNGGHLIADPAGRLIIGFGDGAVVKEVGDPYGHSQDLSTLLGALLRITPTPTSESAYLIPADNPFVGQEASGTRSEILASGLRNPWRFDLDPLTGDLWIADVGSREIEEINYLPAEHIESGPDFGWPAMEGSLIYNGPEPENDLLPVYEYPHGETDDGAGFGIEIGCWSVTGGVVVRGDHLPDLEGSYLFSDFCEGVIRTLRSDGTGGWNAQDLGVTVEAPVSFTRSEDGAVYVISLAGGVWRLDPK